MVLAARLLLGILGTFVCVATALPFIRTDEWWVRIFDFPRLQIFVIGGSVLLLYLLLIRSIARWEAVLATGLATALVIQTLQIYPYTPLAPVQTHAAHQARPESTFSIMVANVMQSNYQVTILQEMISRHDPDLVLLTEIDAWWDAHLQPLTSTYPFTCRYPLGNTYGMSLYSRLPLSNPQVRFVTEAEIPSIYTRVRLRNRTVIHFYGVHPRPPGLKPPETEKRHDSAQRDAELVLIGRESARQSGPVVVAGDFNDVAWSHTTRLFQRISHLLDPRIGRGFFSTFHADIPLLRYPLDHLFHSDDFTFISMERLPSFGSDHFPIAVKLHLNQQAPAKQEPPERKPSDLEESREAVDEYQEKKREEK
ncbi:MAG TPA: endonuclease/exonuclease/phosphatase family protein [Thermodesulfobacteriota bacterium]|nr:endonuclease/exonuclease/phosphatase family protein [Deltaproteobacteria bacterium]HNR14273.1 endonuclease/exonuclease/phosphatase family protein [Thermodesulfobacteriota bacterium]HNU71345.1 endonuclease/exonuclease/phosphatase family protein [Thermodesulfobacteriota bacterium]